MPCRRQYDPRLRDAIHRTQNPHLFRELEIPRTTAAGWLRGDFLPTAGTATLDQTEVELREQLRRLSDRVTWLTALVRVLVVINRIAGAHLDDERVPEGRHKRMLLGVLERTRTTLGLDVALRVVGLSPARYRAWKSRERKCSLDDRPSCPRTHPTQILPDEVHTIRSMVTDPALCHIAINNLALLAQRTGAVFAAPRTWTKLIREHGWRRPRLRRYPAKPRVGVRATQPNEIWHADVTVFRLVDHTRLYLHAVLDNYSRKILAWRLMPRLDPATTCELLCEAAEHLPPLDGGPHHERTDVAVDKGGENTADLVTAFFDDSMKERLRRVIAQIEVAWSNSMIERWFYAFKHQWLYLHDLTSEAQVRELVAFYVAQHNDVMPHHAFHGRTPSEVFEGVDPDLPERLRDQHREALRRRIVENQATRCTTCDPAADAEPEKPPDRTSLDAVTSTAAASDLRAIA